MRRRGLFAVVAASMLVLPGCGAPQAGQAATSTDQQDTDPRLGTVQTFTAERRTPAPPVVGELLDGTAFDLTGWRGQLVVINFWGSWCAPCRAESPELQTAFADTKALGVQFLGVDIRDGRDAAQAFTADFQLSYPSLFDPPGRVVLGFRDVPPNVVPATVLVDRQLRIAAVWRKRITGRELEAAVRALAQESG